MNPAAPARATASETICAKLTLPFVSRPRHLLIADKGPGPLVRLEQSVVFQFTICAHHGIRIHFEVHRELSHGRQLITWPSAPDATAPRTWSTICR